MFSLVPSYRTGGDEHTLEHRWFLLNIRKHFVRVMEHWHKLPSEVVGSPSLEILKSLTPSWAGRVAQRTSRSPFNISHSDSVVAGKIKVLCEIFSPLPPRETSSLLVVLHV